MTTLAVMVAMSGRVANATAPRLPNSSGADVAWRVLGVIFAAIGSCAFALGVDDVERL